MSWYKQYAEVSHKDGTVEKLILSIDRLDYAEHVWDKIEKARTKSRPKYIKKKTLNQPARWTPSWTVYEIDPNDVPKTWLDKWYELQRTLIFATAKKEYYWVGTGDKMFTVHKDYVKIIKIYNHSKLRRLWNRSIQAITSTFVVKK